MSLTDLPPPHATAAAHPALEAAGVVAGYGGRTILHGLDLRVEAGEIYALLGANGAGKTTTLSLFLGFVQPGSGRVRVNGVDPWPTRRPRGASSPTSPRTWRSTST